MVHSGHNRAPTLPDMHYSQYRCACVALSACIVLLLRCTGADAKKLPPLDDPEWPATEAGADFTSLRWTDVQTLGVRGRAFDGQARKGTWFSRFPAAAEVRTCAPVAAPSKREHAARVLAGMPNFLVDDLFHVLVAVCICKGSQRGLLRRTRRSPIDQKSCHRRCNSAVARIRP